MTNDEQGAVAAERRLVWGLLPVVLAFGSAAWAVGCGPSATLHRTGGVGEAEQDIEYSTDEALYAVCQNDRVAIVLAFEPTGALPVIEGPLPLGSPPQPLHYRLYLLLEVDQAGGGYKIGQATRGGRIQATMWSYDEQGGLNQSSPAIGGTVSTRDWPLMQGREVERWLFGTFDLSMALDIRLRGKFRARSSPQLVGRFLRERRI